MTNPHHHEPQGQNEGFERQDMGAKAVYTFLIAMAVAGFLVYFVVGGMYKFLNHYEQANQPKLEPMRQVLDNDVRDTQEEKVAARIDRTFPEPHLETDERNEITDFRTHEEEQLNSYGWVNQSAGVVHIPIERAMQLIAQRGLPVRSQAAVKEVNEAPEKAAALAKSKARKR